MIQPATSLLVAGVAPEFLYDVSQRDVFLQGFKILSNPFFKQDGVMLNNGPHSLNRFQSDG